MTRARAPFAPTACALLFALVVAAPAHAHGNANLGDFYQGLFQPFYHLEFLLAALAIALWAAQQPERVGARACAAFAAAVALGSAIALLGVGGEGTLWGPRLCMLVVGALVAARIRVPGVTCALLAGVAGLAQGHAASAGELKQIARPVLWTLGLGTGAGLLGAYAIAGTQRFRAFWVQIGVRVIGSWIAAIGLLSSVLALRAP